MNIPKSKKDDFYSVGYKKPPTEHQFKKGKSGNPKGRPKKPPKPDVPDDLQELFANLLMKQIPHPNNGDGKTISIGEALVKKSLKDALSGSAKDTLYVLKLIISLGIPQVASERWDKRLAVMLNEEALWTPQMEEQFQAIEAKFAEEQDGGEFDLDEKDETHDCDQTDQSSSPGW